MSTVRLRLAPVLAVVLAAFACPAQADDERVQLPVKVLRREGPWRLIQDPAGDRGWMRDLLLSRQRTAIVTGKGVAEIRKEPSAGSHLQWRVEPGVVGALGECEGDWCEFDAAGHKGFAPRDRLWGSGEP
jgi:SH3-like domain-containing protein